MNTIRKFLKNFYFTLFSNLTTLVISVLIILIVPKVIGVQEYGYWQLYLFYLSFVGFLHFGWNDGIYLRYGGKKYTEIDKSVLQSQLFSLISLQLVISAILLIFTFIYVTDFNRSFIFVMISISLVLTNVRYFFTFILQATNRFKEFAMILVGDRVIYILLIIINLSFGFNDYKFLIISDLVARCISLIIAMYFCKEIVFTNIRKLYFDLHEIYNNVSVGLKLMIANLSGTLIVGVVKFGVERNWDISTFGKISLTLSLAKFVMVFINALGLVLFPLLRRAKSTEISHAYSHIRNLLGPILLGLLLLYFPIKYFMLAWLPEYTLGIELMYILFPIIVFEGKMGILINPFYNTLRLERNILIINILILALSASLCYFSILIFDNLTITLLVIIISLAIRSIIAEIYLSKQLNINVVINLVIEVSFVLMFIIINNRFDDSLSILLIPIIYILVLVYSKNKILFTLGYIFDFYKKGRAL